MDGQPSWNTAQGASKQPSAEEVKSISQSKQSVQPETRLSQPSLRELAALTSLRGTHCHIPQTCLLSPGQSSWDGTEQASLTKARLAARMGTKSRGRCTSRPEPGPGEHAALPQPPQAVLPPRNSYPTAAVPAPAGCARGCQHCLPSQGPTAAQGEGQGGRTASPS